MSTLTNFQISYIVFVNNYNIINVTGANFQKRKFNRKKDEIKELDQASYNWAMSQPVERWTMSYDDGYRYGHATTNCAKGVNSVFKGI